MSDPTKRNEVDAIADIIERYKRGTFIMATKPTADELAKKIRQQLGRELAEARLNNPDKSNEEIIREVCQMDKPTLIDNEPLANHARKQPNDMHHCDKHGGYGFRSDCVECKKEAHD